MIVFKGRIKSLAACVTGATLETLRADSRGFTPPKAGSSLNDCKRFMPEGTWLGRYSSLRVSESSCSAGFRLAVAEKTIDGF